MIQFKIDDAELERALNALGRAPRAELVQAVTAGANVIKGAAERNAPGPHIEISVKKASDVQAEAKIGPDKKHWYYQFAETGAQAHEILSKKFPVLSFEGRMGKLVRTKRVQHKGFAPRPFLRPAAQNKKDEVVAAMGAVFRAAILSKAKG